MILEDTLGNAVVVLVSHHGKVVEEVLTPPDTESGDLLELDGWDYTIRQSATGALCVLLEEHPNATRAGGKH